MSRYILKPISNQSLFKLIISDQTLKNEMNFCLYVHFNGQTFSGVFEQLSFASKFLGFFKVKIVLKQVFFKSSFL